ncbi:hypothetical protein [Larsenimonas rhizosphaerae]|uniref:Uncharacterized protein n=1 Tax=Larsenimonas rhizosphaerae TaxID=2944682 RepID=A0AA41ZHL3_9GAMM|nr:hypothetical protein [Larsenimonas rhizosphaerae]MCX2524836.1 hypothetical protein [Larsenimonas rhizosphaerae]
MSGKIIAVGALGGSGTRAVADVLMALGGFFGDDINESRDNLTFTRLFKDPEWFACAEKKDIQRRLEVFQNYMCGNLSISDLMFFIKASSKNGIMKNEPPSFKLLGKHFFCNQVIDSFWGRNEPNTHIYRQYYRLHE